VSYPLPNECSYLQGRMAGGFVANMLPSPGATIMKGAKMAAKFSGVASAIAIVDKIDAAPAKMARMVSDAGGVFVKGSIRGTAKFLSKTGQVLGEWVDVGGKKLFKYTKSLELNTSTWRKVRTETDIDFQEVGGIGIGKGIIEVWEECAIGGTGTLNNSGARVEATPCKQAIKAVVSSIIKFTKASEWKNFVNDPSCNACKGWWTSRLQYDVSVPINFSGIEWDKIKKKASKVIYDCFGFPDFSPFVAVYNGMEIIVTIPEMNGSSSDFTAAKNAAIEMGVSSSIFSGNNATIDGIQYTWHHHQDCEKMLLVPSLLNNNTNEFRHLGGNSLSQAGMKGKIPKFGEIINCD
jgi:hypothetical protein